MSSNGTGKGNGGGTGTGTKNRTRSPEKKGRKQGGGSSHSASSTSTSSSSPSRSQKRQLKDEQETASLGKLLSALALGARAVHALPIGDDFAYEESFPEFSSLASARRQDLIHILSLAMDQDLEEDPAVWETCADACDWLLEQAEAYLKTESDGKVVVSWGHTARQQAQSTLGRILDGIVDMEKPQTTYSMMLVDNDRLSPFVPKAHPDKPFGTVPLDLSLRNGRAADTRYGGSPDATVELSDEVVGPTHHAPHPYRHEIASLSCDWKVPTTKPADLPEAPKEYDATWVGTIESLQDLAKALESVEMAAVDLEAHNYRSFSGFLCLMQITIRNEQQEQQNYLVDTLGLWEHINPQLAPFFANPDIVKVMHGADSDVCWLQRDFGIYVVNMLDTGRAARLLQYPSFGLAYLLHRFAGIQPDKKHQLSDWRQRPIPGEMKRYAIMDTYFLLDIVQHLLWEVSTHHSPQVTVNQLFENSQTVCRIRYDKDVFRPNGYKALINNHGNNSKRKSKSDLSAAQERVLKALYDWRDQTARTDDESLQYVCPNKALLRLALSSPTTVTALQSLLNPIPPLVLRRSAEILDRIQKANPAKNTGGKNTTTKTATRMSSAFFKPAVPEKEGTPTPTPTRGLLSPVLGTEALYRQAGWTTPQVQEADGIVTTTTDDDDDDEMDMGGGNSGGGGSGNKDSTRDRTMKPRNLLVVDKANKQYKSTEYSSHSLEMNRPSRGKSADGSASSAGLHSPGHDTTMVSTSAGDVRKALEEKNVLGLISSDGRDQKQLTNDEKEDDDDDDDVEDDEEENEGDGTPAEQGEEDEFQVPRSLKEIYKISNRNRRNKKAVSPPPGPDRGTSQTFSSDDALARANAVIEARGKGYFDTGNKRQRKGSDAGGATDDNGGGGGDEASPGREDNVGFMTNIGWIKDKTEADNLQKEAIPGETGTDMDSGNTEGTTKESPGPSSSSTGAGTGTGAGGIPPSSSKPFDYGAIGNIGVYNPRGQTNPFFSGGSGPLHRQQQQQQQQQQGREGHHGGNQYNRKGRGGARGRRGRGNSRQERPERKDGRTFVYKKK